MKRLSFLSPLFIFLFIFTGCASMKPAKITHFDNQDIHNYTYFYITPTQELSSSSGVVGTQYGVYGGITKTVNPSDVISGILIKNGFIGVNEVKSENASKTMLINYGESGRRNVNLGYSIEVTIQFVDVSTQEPILVCTAEGQGSTEADDIRKAINRALEPLFNNQQ